MNILITSAGRRGYIVEYFKEAINGHGKVFVGNSTPIAPSFFYSDESVVTPLIYSDDYIPFLINYCQANNIRVIISLFDIDLQILAQNKKYFKEHDITVIVSDEDTIKKCNDKWLTYLFATHNDILTPKTFLHLSDVMKALKNGEVNFPFMIKPRWGMGSLAIYQADDIDELKVLYKKCRKEIQKSYLKYEASADYENCVVIQEKIEGKEYGIDIINNLEGEFCTDVVREKVAMRAGETDCAIVIQNQQMDIFARDISFKLKHISNLDVDVFYSDDKIYLLEMNARFGGGYPFSHIAGINLPAAIIKWVEKKNLNDELKIKKYNKLIQKDINFLDLTEYRE